MTDLAALPGTYVLNPVDVELASAAALGLTVAPGHGLSQDYVMSRSVSFEVEPYFVAGGLPWAEPATGVSVVVECGVGDLDDLGRFPDPWEVDTGAGSRWLPLGGTYEGGAVWSPYRGTERVRLVSEAGSPVLDETYSYERGRAVVPGRAMLLRDGAHFWTDDARWVSNDVTVLMVAVLHRPDMDWYGLLETSSSTPEAAGPGYVGMRYRSDGQVEVFVGDAISGRPVPCGSARLGQPVIVGFSLSVAQRVLRTVVVDTEVHWESHALAATHPYDARLHVGRTPGGELAHADMDVLEVDYWAGPGVDAGEKVAMLNSIYGVSVT